MEQQVPTGLLWRLFGNLQIMQGTSWFRLKRQQKICAYHDQLLLNLAWAVNRVIARLEAEQPSSIDQIRQVTLNEAQAIAAEDIHTNQLISLNAQSLVPQKAVFIHHCNTGALATVDYGTALGIIRTAHEMGKEVFVFVDETRPRLQGARLTTWELNSSGSTIRSSWTERPDI